MGIVVSTSCSEPLISLLGLRCRGSRPSKYFLGTFLRVTVKGRSISEKVIGGNELENRVADVRRDIS